MEGQYTVKDVIQITVNLLGSISVPRNLNQQIGMPIDNAIANLNECLKVINQAEAEEKEKTEE